MKKRGKAGYDIIIFSFCYARHMYNLVNCRKIFLYRMFKILSVYVENMNSYACFLFCYFSNNIWKYHWKMHGKKKCIKINRIANMKRQLWSRECILFIRLQTLIKIIQSLIVFPFSFPNRILVWNSIGLLSFYFFLVFRFRIATFFVRNFIFVINLLCIIRNAIRRNFDKNFKTKVRKISIK